MRFGSPKPWSRWWHAPVLLLVYQIAPVQAHLDETGRIQVGLGFSGGHYEDRAFSCGDLVRRSPVTYRVIGGQAEVWASRSVRFSAGGGVLRSSSDSGRVELPKGAFGSMLGAYEGKNFGIGGGVTAWPGTLIEYGEKGYRFGVASGYSERWQPRWFAGLMGQEKTSGIGGELGFPVGQRLEPVIHGSASFSKDSPGWSLGLAVRTGLGKTRRP
jgi:hypothetical protein